MTTDVAEQWLERVMHEHRELNALVAELQDFLDRPRPAIGEPGYHTWAAGLSQRLVDLHDRLFRHFRFEEDDGMRERLLERHPRATARIEKVMGEHPQMLAEVRKLMSDSLFYSEGREPEEPALRRRLKAILLQLKNHEREETDLIQRLEYRDIGAAD